MNAADLLRRHQYTSIMEEYDIDQGAVRDPDDPVALLKAAADLLRCGVGEVVPRAEALAAEVKRLEGQAKAKAGGGSNPSEGPFK